MASGASTGVGAGGVGSILFEPSDDVLVAGAEAAGRVQRGAVGVVGFPVQVGAGGQEAFGGAALPARAGVPERLGHLLRRRLAVSSSSSRRSSMPSAPACHSLSTRAPRATRRRATCQQPYPMALSSGVPIDPSGTSMSAPPSISAAATSTSSLLACPVQRRFGAWLGVSEVGIGAGRDQERNDLGAVGEVARPVGHHVQSRAGLEAATERAPGELGGVGERSGGLHRYRPTRPRRPRRPQPRDRRSWPLKQTRLGREAWCRYGTRVIARARGRLAYPIDRTGALEGLLRHLGPRPLWSDGVSPRRV